MSGLRQREPRYENRKLLDLAHEAPCMLNIAPYGCSTNPSVPCHSDMLAHGKGVGAKSHDYLAVPGCPECHAVFTREKLGREGYERTWRHAKDKYERWLWVNGKIKVV